MALTKQERRFRIRKRIRKTVKGTASVPRLSVFRSNKQISAQLINDIEGITLVSVSSLSKEIFEKKSITKIEKAGLVGSLIAKRAIDARIAKVIFDRSGYLYHGRVKALAEAARIGGLNF